MLLPGLVSVTFRHLTPAQIIPLATQAHLQGIEWGGDIHVPHGDLPAAKSTRKLTRDAGLQVAAYGSYYRAGDPDSPSFDAVLDTALELAAPTIRVWAGRQPSATATAAYRAAVTQDLHRIATLAQSANIPISLEFHKGTLTDTHQSTSQLLAESAHPNLRTYWQPPEGLSTADSLTTLRALRPQISNIHVFHWSIHQGQTLQHPLSDGLTPWQTYLAEFANPNESRWALLEFVRHNDPAQFLADAATLHHLIDSQT